MTARHLALALIVLAPSIPRDSGACSPLQINGGEWTHEPLAGDVEPPIAVTASYEIKRFPISEGTGCGDAPCGGWTFVLLDLASTDDRTPADRIGYRFAIASGQPPEGLYIGQTWLASDGELGLRYYGDGAFSFDLEITALDQNGNESEPVVISIDG